jgi:hypothetical protein
LKRAKKWGDNFREEYLVEDVVTGEKITKVSDTTQIMTRVGPNIEAEVTGAGRKVAGDVNERSVTWVGPAGDTNLIKKLKIPVNATPQDLVHRMCLAMKKQGLNSAFVSIEPEGWKHERDPSRL